MSIGLLQALLGGHIPAALVVALKVLLLGMAVVTFLKGKVGFGLLGIVAFPFWIIGAFRVAKPASWWARRSYGSAKLALGRRRFGSGEPVVGGEVETPPGYRVRPFCVECTVSTIDQSAGGMFRLNGCGLGFYGWQDRCGLCGSVMRWQFISFIWLPVVPVGRYRVIYTRDGIFSSEYYSRKVKPST